MKFDTVITILIILAIAFVLYHFRVAILAWVKNHEATGIAAVKKLEAETTLLKQRTEEVLHITTQTRVAADAAVASALPPPETTSATPPPAPPSAA